MVGNGKERSARLRSCTQTSFRALASPGTATRWTAYCRRSDLRHQNGCQPLGGLAAHKGSRRPPDDPERARISLADYARSWLAQQAHLAPRTVEIYRNQLERHILPEVDGSVLPLGDLSLNELTPEVIRSWYQTLVVNRTKSTAAKAYVRLRQVLNQAVDDERILRNPCRIRRGGVERHEEQRFATMPELLEIAQLAPERYRVLILTAGLGGLRQGDSSVSAVVTSTSKREWSASAVSDSGWIPVRSSRTRRNPAPASAP